MRNKLLNNLLFGFFIGIVAFLQVIILNQYSTYGEKLTRINQKISETEKENKKLSQSIASASSMYTLSEKAKILGLTKNLSIISLSSSLPVAQSLETSL